MTVFLALGGNIGDSVAILREAAQKISQWSVVDELQLSPLFQTAAVSDITQPDFVNGVVKFQTQLAADVLMERCWQLEKQYGVKELLLNGPRALDIDLLFYGNERIKTPTLQVPHPRWQERLFVLEPLRELVSSVNGILLDPLIEELRKKVGSEQRVDKLK